MPSHCRNASSEPDFQTDRVQKLAESRRVKTEPPTVFIDLRQTEPSEPQEHQSQERYKAVLETVPAGEKEGQKAKLLWVESGVPFCQHMAGNPVPPWL